MLFTVVKFFTGISKPPGKSETTPLCVFSMLPSEISVYLVVAVLLLAFYFPMQNLARIWIIFVIVAKFTILLRYMKL